MVDNGKSNVCREGGGGNAISLCSSRRALSLVLRCVVEERGGFGNGRIGVT